MSEVKREKNIVGMMFFGLLPGVAFAYLFPLVAWSHFFDVSKELTQIPQIMTGFSLGVISMGIFLKRGEDIRNGIMFAVLTTLLVFSKVLS